MTPIKHGKEKVIQGGHGNRCKDHHDGEKLDSSLTSMQMNRILWPMSRDQWMEYYYEERSEVERILAKPTKEDSC